MEQQFLGVETQLEPQIHNNLTEHRMMGAGEGRLAGSGLAGAPGASGPRQLEEPGSAGRFKSDAYDLAHPPSTALSATLAMLGHGGNYTQYPVGAFSAGHGGHPSVLRSVDGSIGEGLLSLGPVANGLAPAMHVGYQSEHANSVSDVPTGVLGDKPARKTSVEHQHSVLQDQQDAEQNINSDGLLMAPIPPLHVQQQLVNSLGSTTQKEEVLETPLVDQLLRSSCTRCKKEFDQPIIIPQASDQQGPKPLAEPKIFKLCQHCRDLQRKRSRRWQKKTKDKSGACRRCGLDIPADQQKYVLCPSCRENLRTRKANRAAQGKCVHCSGPLDASIITGDEKGPDGTDRSKMGQFKVCQRCRENDKIRRTNLERRGHCNRCAKSLDASDIGKHKVCLTCRTRKKRGSTSKMVLSGGSPSEAPPLGAAPVGIFSNDLAALNMLNQTLLYPVQRAMPQQYSSQDYLPMQAQQQPVLAQFLPAHYNPSVVQRQAMNQAYTQAQVQAQAQAQAQVQAQVQAQAQAQAQAQNQAQNQAQARLFAQQQALQQYLLSQQQQQQQYIQPQIQPQLAQQALWLHEPSNNRHTSDFQNSLPLGSAPNPSNTTAGNTM